METQNKLLQEVSKHVKQLASQDSEHQKLFKNAKVCAVKEFKFKTEDKKESSALVVYLPYPYYKDHKNQVKEMSNFLTEKRKQHTFVLAKRTIINKKSDFKQKIPQSRTLTAVYDAVLEDLVLPGFLIGKRTRVRLDGTHLVKAYVDEKYRDYLEPKTELISHLYKALTDRRLAVEFKPNESFISIPQVRTQQRKNRRRQHKKNNQAPFL